MRHDHLDITFGLKFQPKGYIFQTDCYDKFQIIAVSRGSIHYATPEARQVLRSGTVAILRPGSVFTLRCPRTSYSGFYVHTSAVGQPGFGGTNFAGKVPQGIAQSLEELESEIHSASPWADQVAESLAHQVLWQIMRFLEPEGPSPDDADPYVQYWANRVKNAIDTTLFTGIAVREALDNLRFSYRQLSRIFQSVYGLSPKAYQVEARLGIAEELLVSSTQPISGIASELNYPSSQHFAAQFKKARGLTPSQYRERHSFSIDNGSSPEGISG